MIDQLLCSWILLGSGIGRFMGLFHEYLQAGIGKGAIKLIAFYGFSSITLIMISMFIMLYLDDYKDKYNIQHNANYCPGEQLKLFIIKYTPKMIFLSN